ncbi:glycosyltransferase [Polaromonas sp. AER18D-145]|uniref:glycosyltransferase n=1 Tax=Polaromonas sp. AER18D-145 TaxID=1977060 RepID=UPI000BBBC485|nr:glycosyltransferase [Polaromonas sp. AER18D-145]
MRVLNVTNSLDLKTGGGTAERTFQMSRFLALDGVTCTVLTLNLGLDTQRVQELAHVRVEALDCLLPRFYVPSLGWQRIRRLVDQADVIHLMGHWSVLNALVYLAARRAGKPYVVCPAGALPLFGRSAWIKRAYNLLIGNAIIRNAAAWIAVTEGEFSHFEQYRIAARAVTIIPNGVSVPDAALLGRSVSIAQKELTATPYILFMGRLNRIKGPDLLLEAFVSIASQLPGLHLLFAGPDGGMLAELRATVEQQELARRVHFLGHVDGEAKANVYRSASLLVVPSRQEAMSIVALEASIFGTPVLITDQCGFNELAVSIDPRLVVSATVPGLATGMVDLLADPLVLARVGQRLKEFVETRYAWSIIIGEYTTLYKKIIGARLSALSRATTPP